MDTIICRAKGIFFLHTNEKSPFALGQQGQTRSLPTVEKSTFWNDLFGFNKRNEKSEVTQYFDKQFDRLVNWKNGFVDKIKNK